MEKELQLFHATHSKVWKSGGRGRSTWLVSLPLISETPPLRYLPPPRTRQAHPCSFETLAFDYERSLPHASECASRNPQRALITWHDLTIDLLASSVVCLARYYKVKTPPIRLASKQVGEQLVYGWPKIRLKGFGVRFPEIPGHREAVNNCHNELEGFRTAANDQSRGVSHEGSLCTTNRTFLRLFNGCKNAHRGNKKKDEHKIKQNQSSESCS